MMSHGDVHNHPIELESEHYLDYGPEPPELRIENFCGRCGFVLDVPRSNGQAQRDWVGRSLISYKVEGFD